MNWYSSILHRLYPAFYDSSLLRMAMEKYRIYATFPTENPIHKNLKIEPVFINICSVCKHNLNKWNIIFNGLRFTYWCWTKRSTCFFLHTNACLRFSVKIYDFWKSCCHLNTFLQPLSTRNLHETSTVLEIMGTCSFQLSRTQNLSSLSILVFQILVSTIRKAASVRVMLW